MLLAPTAQAAPGGKSPQAPHPDRPAIACEALKARAFAPANATVTEATSVPASSTAPATCQVTLTVSDPEDGGKVTVWVHMPERTWNGRYQAVGGGGFSGGDPGRLAGAVQQGYAASATDAGHVGSSGTFGLNPDGTPNHTGREDFGHEGVHDMAVAAKSVVTTFYGRAPEYSYWNGCSTGGRQGLMEAQNYPDDFDGIFAGAPVINFPEMQTGQIWGQIVMLQENNPVPACKFETALKAAVAACDTVGDGVVDGVIGDPFACDFDLTTLIGTETACGTITAKDVAVMQRIHEGPRGTDGRFLWYGLPYGAPYAGLHNTKLDDQGQLVGDPFIYDIWWIRYFLTDDPSFDWRTLDYASFEGLFDLAVERYGDMMGASDTDLSAFRDSGGKLLMWHGAADFGVTVKGTVDYYERLEERFGEGTDDFARLFLAPGVGHCSGGAGPELTNGFGALVEWVENGTAPATLDAAKAGVTRPVCAYPLVAEWTGFGDWRDGSNFECVAGTRMELRQP
ncbi:tannase/feruloyl esterase family alpha/beta hydrolase [Blastococcus saxobsidens]|uniref:tannase/feruloyl esterase family alpha/beta hydrolase n=1 Tax=Blastococcus saxobsidens TaxID=138336 RepID=UPI00102AE825|nr:tannase/feruloyl esterase family alpha/beta hydrolase [Blastococcus saxobsidens]